MPAAGQPPTLAELKARRDEEDRAAAERKSREDAALNRYSAAVKAGAVVDTKLAKDLAALEVKATQLRKAAAERRASSEANAAAALAELTNLGRSVEQVARWVKLPLKRVRRMVNSVPKVDGAAKDAAAGKATTARSSPRDPVVAVDESAGERSGNGADAPGDVREVADVGAKATVGGTSE